LTAIEGLKSYTIESEQTISQQMAMSFGEQSMNIVNDIIQTVDFQVAKNGDSYNASGTLEQNTVTDMGAAGSTDTTLTFELVTLDGETYVRASGDAGMLGGVLPEGWTSLSDPSAGTNPIFATLSGENLTRLYNQALPINETTVVGIEELDGSRLGAAGMRVFQIDYNPSALIESGMFDSLGSALSGSGSGAAAGIDVEQLLQDMFEDAEITYTVYVGDDDGLVHQLDSTMAIDATLNMQGMSIPLVMSIDSTTVFTNFNEPVTIEAPELGT
jgi:hypothetical protein